MEVQVWNEPEHGYLEIELADYSLVVTQNEAADLVNKIQEALAKNRGQF